MNAATTTLRGIRRLGIRFPRLAEAVNRTRRESPPPLALHSSAYFERREILGRPVLVVTPKEGASSDHVIYYHGGGYSHPLLAAHWIILAALSRQSKATIWIPSYPLAPEHTVDDSLPLVDELNRVVGEAAGRGRFVVMGDSAGGGLAMVHAIRARDAAERAGTDGSQPERLPDDVVLFFPWSDVSMKNPQAIAMAPDEPALDLEPLIQAGKWWAGSRPVEDPLVSPLYADLAGLPRLTVFAGGADLLTPDTRTMVAQARKAGVDVEYVERPGAFHGYIGWVAAPEAREDLRHAADVVRGIR